VETIWAICILYCIVSSETQFETWWWPSERAETCCLSNKYSTTLLVECSIPLSISHLVLNCKLAIVFVHVCIYINNIGQMLREGVSGRWLWLWGSATRTVRMSMEVPRTKSYSSYRVRRIANTNESERLWDVFVLMKLWTLPNNWKTETRCWICCWKSIWWNWEFNHCGSKWLQDIELVFITRWLPENFFKFGSKPKQPYL